jgi:hypothetical protein
MNEKLYHVKSQKQLQSVSRPKSGRRST